MTDRSTGADEARPLLLGVVALLGALVLCLTACQSSGGPLASRSATRTALPSRSTSTTAPSRTTAPATRTTSAAPTKTSQPAPSQPASSKPGAGGGVTRTRTQTQTQTQTHTQTPTTSAVTPPAPSTATTPSTAPAASSSTGSDLTWLWWLLGGLAVLAAILVPLIVRQRRRRRWSTDLDRARSELEWLLRDLLPRLQQGRSVDEIVGGWRVEAGRVLATEDRLTQLAAAAPNQPDRDQVTRLRDVVRDSRLRLDGLAAQPDMTIAQEQLRAVGEQLYTTLHPPAAGPPPAPAR